MAIIVWTERDRGVLLNAPGTTIVNVNNTSSFFEKIGFKGRSIVMSGVEIDKHSVFCPRELLERKNKAVVVFLQGSISEDQSDFVVYNGWKDAWLQFLVAKHKELFLE